MPNDDWRPLGVNDDEQIAAYDALHDGVPKWMAAAFWAWVRGALTKQRRHGSGYNTAYNPHLDEELAERMAQTLQIDLPNLRTSETGHLIGQKKLNTAVEVFMRHTRPLQIADYLLAHGKPSAAPLDALLDRSKSAWKVGERAGRPGLVRRIPEGVQAGADLVISRSSQAGARLAKAWEHLYGLVPNPSQAYRLAILSVEDAAIPVVSPNNRSATLGTVLKQMEDQGDWSLPLTREHPKAPTQEVLTAIMRTLWHGQHDRHGGQPSAPGDVSHDEATVAVAMATTLVHWFADGLVSRNPAPR